MSAQRPIETPTAAASPPQDARGVRVSADFGPHLKRVRLLLQRYVIALEPDKRLDLLGAGSDSSEDPVRRCLLGLDFSQSRQSALDALAFELEQTGYEAIAAAQTPGATRFEQIRNAFGLDTLACDCLWLMLAGELVPEFSWFYRELWRNRQRSSFERTFLAHVLDPLARHPDAIVRLFAPTAPLLTHHLVFERGTHRHDEDSSGAALMSTSLRLRQHVLGVTPDFVRIEGLVAIHPPLAPRADGAAPPPRAVIERLKQGFAGRRRFVLVGPDAAGPLHLARRTMSDMNWALLEVHCAELLGGGEDAIVKVLGEARMRGAALYLDAVEALFDEAAPRRLRRLVLDLLDSLALPQFYRGGLAMNSATVLDLVEQLDALELPVTLPSASERAQLWDAALQGLIEDPARRERVAFAARVYPLGPQDIERALGMAKLLASRRPQARRRVVLQAIDVERGCQQVSSQRISSLAQRVQVEHDWPQVVLGERTGEVIEEMRRFGRLRDEVFGQHGYGDTLGQRGRALTALFWGPPGTGKTLVSGLIARDLGLDLYQIELSQIVSKYIGETEQHLARIFDEAQANGMALLFDEADSLFASRTQVKSSVDRYANLETNYLLQRIEAHDGLIILTTNLPKSLDEAFMRRIRFKVEFAAPDAAARARLWQVMIPAAAPREPDIDFNIIGELYEMTGGEIRNAVMRAAFLAADQGRALSFEHLEQAAITEFREQGRLVAGLDAYEEL